MSPESFLHDILTPGILWCEQVPGWNVPFDDRARVLMLAIAGQESNWTDRIQHGNGPAHSQYQMERMGGVHGVLHHPAACTLAIAACTACNVPADETHVWGIMATAAGDNLATAFARLLLRSDPFALPAFGAEKASWGYYTRLWRPGKPDRKRWSRVYPQAMAAVREGEKG